MDGVRSRAADKGSRTATDNDTHVQWLVAERNEMLRTGFVGVENVGALAMWSGSVAQALGESDEIRRQVMDVCFRPLGTKLPTIVVMSGWSHTGEDMFRDMRDYMTRGNGAVRVVLILKWSMDTVAAIVSCELKVYEHIGNRPDGLRFIMRQREEILPEPPSTGSVKIKLGDICSAKLPPGEDAKEYSVPLARLRKIAQRFIREDGFRLEGREDVDSDSDEVDDDDDDDDDDEAVDSNASLVSGFRGCTVAGTSVTGGSHSQSDISGNYSGNSLSNNKECFNENYSAKRLSVVRLNLPEEYLSHSLSIVARKKLGAFFKSPNRFLRKLARRCAETGQRVCNDLEVSYDYLPDLSKVALYDTVVLCDDSGSMRSDGRYDMMRETILKISDVCTAFRDEGISVKFINFRGDGDYNNIRDRERLDQVVSRVKPKGGTRLGTVLRNKIVEPLVIQKAKGESFERPVFVTIITDGEPSGEDRDELKRTIRNCKRELAELKGPSDVLYGGSAVEFQISLVGNSDAAKSYAKELEDDEEIKHLVYCTKERLDVVKSGMTDPKYTGWLIQLLAAAIDHE